MFRPDTFLWKTSVGPEFGRRSRHVRRAVDGNASRVARSASAFDLRGLPRRMIVRIVLAHEAGDARCDLGAEARAVEDAVMPNPGALEVHFVGGGDIRAE